MNKPHRRVNTERGFNLVELMITVAIVAILASIAIPSYTQYIAKGRRADARAQLIQAAQFMQRFYSANDRFDQNRAGQSVSNLIPASVQTSPPDGTAVYRLSVSATASAYTLTMAPVAGSTMASDECGSFTLTSTGVKGVTGSLSRDECWK